MFLARLARRATWSRRQAVLGLTSFTVAYYAYRRDRIWLDSDEPTRRKYESLPSTTSQSFSRPTSKLQEQKSVQLFSDSPSLDEDLRKYEESYIPGIGGISKIDLVQFAWYCSTHIQSTYTSATYFEVANNGHRMT